MSLSACWVLLQIRSKSTWDCHPFMLFCYIEQWSKNYERYNSLILADRACFKLEMMMVFQNFWHFNLFEMSKFHRKLQRSFSWQPCKVINFETFVCRRIFLLRKKNTISFNIQNLACTVKYMHLIDQAQIDISRFCNWK